MRTITFILVLLFSATAFSQKSPFKLGDIKTAYFDEIDNEKYASEKAVILSDWGHSTLNGADLTFKHQRRILILNEEGLDLAELEFVYGNGRSVNKIKGYTHNLEGGNIVATELEKNDIVVSTLDNGFKMKKAAFRNVKAGTIIEFEYTMIYENRAYSLRSWDFQHEIPCKWTQYSLWLPNYFEYKTLMHGFEALDHATVNPKAVTGNKYELKYQATNVSPFKKEPYMTCDRDYLSYIEFEINRINHPELQKTITGQKEDLVRDLLADDDFGHYLDGMNFLRKEVEVITADKSTDYDKMIAIHTYMKENFKWDGKLRLYSYNRPKKVFEAKKGNSSEINMMLTSMLRHAGIKASPVVLSTRLNGRQLPYFLLAKRYNNTVVQARVDGKVYMLDATNPYLPVGQLPFRCLNGEGLVVDPNQPAYFVSLDPEKKSTRSVQVIVEIDEEDNLVGTMNSSMDGYYSYNTRIEVFKEKEKKEANVVADDAEDEIENDFEIEVLEYSVTNKSDCQKPFMENAKIKVIGAVENTGDMIYLSPIVMSKIDENPFKLDERKYPVDFGYNFQSYYTMSLKIPEGFHIADIPEKQAIMLPEKAGIFQYNIAQNGDNLIITNRLLINKTQFVSQEYPYLKEFYDIVVSKHAEQIVLKKVSGL